MLKCMLWRIKRAIIKTQVVNENKIFSLMVRFYYLYKRKKKTAGGMDLKKNNKKLFFEELLADTLVAWKSN